MYTPHGRIIHTQQLPEATRKASDKALAIPCGGQSGVKGFKSLGLQSWRWFSVLSANDGMEACLKNAVHGLKP